eukprot:gnl/TRDRNA2_/TRDRNA2_46384_c0_seq1.p1 gnl/TRDRNA2_/TRDRNA2_46384_c0~~gnl/TRDRNA2_/TRDRNA2_46384_c0_seq1.p1  ORF type:complete len:198 (-),score=38.52 gnl/TRDRNA2_/TRDRNA2_46384_c0_seq1:559-1152(-)
MPPPSRFGCEPSLEFAWVNLPWDKTDASFFGINVASARRSGQWMVMRRYEHFSTLRKALVASAPALKEVAFPIYRQTLRRWRGRCTQSMIEWRRDQLENWLQQVLDMSPSHSEWAPLLREFFVQDVLTRDKAMAMCKAAGKDQVARIAKEASVKLAEEAEEGAKRAFQVFLQRQPSLAHADKPRLMLPGIRPRSLQQ